MAATLQPIPVQAESDLFLREAFTSFNQAAATLERSYHELQLEVTRLRREREKINLDLAQSLHDNRQLSSYLNHILEALPCGVLVIDRGGDVAKANPEARRLLGLKQDEPDRIPECVIPLLHCTEPGSGERTFQNQGCWLTVRRAELEEEGSRQVIFILRDITEAKRLEQMEEALRRRQALAEMSAVLAHEIRNPLGSLELFAGLLADSPLDPEGRQWVRHIQAGLRLLAATVNNVLQFHSQPQPELAPADLGQLLSSVEQFLSPLVERSRVVMEVDNPLWQVRVPGDRNRLAQVLLNIALNALRFMPDGGSLRIHGEVSADQHAVIRLTDSGPGIAAEHIDRIFEPGFTTQPGSPGLGLAVCKTVMEQHGATISASSQFGEGTTFTLTFPLWREA